MQSPSETTDAEEDANDNEESENVVGRRVVDIVPFFEAVQRLNSHNRTNDCNFSDMRLVKEFKQGLKSIFTFTCDKCGYTGIIISNADSNKQLEVGIGVGYSIYGLWHVRPTPESSSK